MNKKQKLGQFYTTNSKYITTNLLDIFPQDSIVVDPFSGNWDLLNLLDKNIYTIEAFDIDPKNNDTIKRDMLKNPIDYTGKWIFTNPPYLARNKSKNKMIYDKYKLDDLYKAAMKSIIGCEGGILIIPLNFFSSKDIKIRKLFLSNYEVISLNVFEEKVFEDTSYTICSFSFVKKQNNNQMLNVNFFPSKEKAKFEIDFNLGYSIGKDFIEKILIGKNSKIKISRLLEGEDNGSKIFLRAIDTGSKNGTIKLEKRAEPYYGKNSDRTFATIKLPELLNEEDQDTIIKIFNNELKKYRKKYHSMFLSNFRNSTAYCARKRIDFDSVYNFIKWIIKKNKLGNL